VLVVARLDRLGRSLPHLIEVVRELNDRGIDFRSLSEALDTTSPGGRLLFHIAAAFAEFERDLIRERTLMGLAAAREQGRVGGRPRAMKPEKLAAAKALLAERVTQEKAAEALGVSVRTLTRALAR
jgi:DNA invertase Pin-like site-specific DNA recombinase